MQLLGTPLQSKPGVGASSVSTAAEAMKGELNSYWAVVDPMVIQDMIPRDLRTNATKQAGIVSPTKQAFDVFGTFDEAASYAQRMNRPLVIMGIKAESRVIPQLPLVEKITPGK